MSFRLLIAIQSAATGAQSRLTIPLDGTFVASPIGLPRGVTNPDLALTVIFHKVILRHDRIYVCGAFKS